MKISINPLMSTLLLTFLIPMNVRALVDYSDVSPQSEDRGKINQMTKKMEKMENPAQKSLAWKADYSLVTNYEAMEIDGDKTSIVNVGAHVQTPVNVFFDLSYWSALNKQGSSNGNPKFILGFNWLRIGSPSEEAKFDIYGGVRLPAKSALGSSRTDKIVGVETTKRFGTFGLGIGYDLTIVGSPKNSEEMAIGNVSRIAFSGGWMVSNDIQFEVEAENFSINEKNGNYPAAKLNKKVNFSTLSPKLNLALAPAINLEMGARFRMKKPKTEDKLSSAGVFDLHGANANSLFAGLNLAL